MTTKALSNNEKTMLIRPLTMLRQRRSLKLSVEEKSTIVLDLIVFRIERDAQLLANRIALLK